MHDKDIDFIVGKFKEGTFSTDSNWRRFKAMVGLRRRRIGVAAAVAAVIVVSATAAVFTYRYGSSPVIGEETTHLESIDEIPTYDEPKMMVFESSKLSEVIESIEKEYGVKIGNIPSNSDDYVLTLRYEGTPVELIEAINEILGTHLTVEEI